MGASHSLGGNGARGRRSGSNGWPAGSDSRRDWPRRRTRRSLSTLRRGDRGGGRGDGRGLACSPSSPPSVVGRQAWGFEVKRMVCKAFLRQFYPVWEATGALGVTKLCGRAGACRPARVEWGRRIMVRRVCVWRQKETAGTGGLSTPVNLESRRDVRRRIARTESDFSGPHAAAQPGGSVSRLRPGSVPDSGRDCARRRYADEDEDALRSSAMDVAHSRMRSRDPARRRHVARRGRGPQAGRQLLGGRTRTTYCWVHRK